MKSVKTNKCVGCGATIANGKYICTECYRNPQKLVLSEKRELIDKEMLLMRIHSANPQTVSDCIMIICEQSGVRV